jgi:hypothetical protein
MKRLNNNSVSKVRLTENKLRNIVSESVKTALKYIIKEESLYGDDYNEWEGEPDMPNQYIYGAIEDSDLGAEEKDWLMMIADDNPELFDAANECDSFRAFLYEAEEWGSVCMGGSDMRKESFRYR